MNANKAVIERIKNGTDIFWSSPRNFAGRPDIHIADTMAGTMKIRQSWITVDILRLCVVIPLLVTIDIINDAIIVNSIIDNISINIRCIGLNLKFCSIISNYLSR